MSKHRCPLCERKGWEVKRRTWKLWREAVRDGIPVLDYTDSPAAHEQLMQLVKSKMYGGEKQAALDKKTPWQRGDEKLMALFPEAESVETREAMLKRDLLKAKQREYRRKYYREHKDAMNERRKLNQQRARARANGQPQ